MLMIFPRVLLRIKSTHALQAEPYILRKVVRMLKVSLAYTRLPVLPTVQILYQSVLIRIVIKRSVPFVHSFIHYTNIIIVSLA